MNSLSRKVNAIMLFGINIPSLGLLKVTSSDEGITIDV